MLNLAPGLAYRRTTSGYTRDSSTTLNERGETVAQRHARELDGEVRAHRHATRDGANLTLPNGAMPSLGNPPVHIHIHDSTGEEVGGKTLYGPKNQPMGYAINTDNDPAARRPAMREPAISDPQSDLSERVGNLETVVAGILTGNGDDMDGEGGTPLQSEQGEDVNQQLASAMTRQSSADALPATPAEINQANRAAWNLEGRNMTGGAAGIPPNGQGTPGRTDSGIDQNRRLSTGAKRMEAGETWGTSDAAIKRARLYRRQTTTTNRDIRSIQAKNAAFYR